MADSTQTLAIVTLYRIIIVVVGLAFGFWAIVYFAMVFMSELAI